MNWSKPTSLIVSLCSARVASLRHTQLASPFSPFLLFSLSLFTMPMEMVKWSNHAHSAKEANFLSMRIEGFRDSEDVINGDQFGVNTDFLESVKAYGVIWHDATTLDFNFIKKSIFPENRGLQIRRFAKTSINSISWCKM